MKFVSEVLLFVLRAAHQKSYVVHRLKNTVYSTN